MAVNSGVRDSVRETNLVHVWDAFTNILLKDPGFHTNEFMDSLAFAKERLGDQLFVKYDGDPFKSREEWDAQYWNEQCAAIVDDFCMERIQHMMDIGKMLYPTPPQIEQMAARTTSASVRGSKKKRTSLREQIKKKIKGLLPGRR